MLDSPNVGIVSPTVIYKDNERYSDLKTDIIDVEWVITSASLTNVSAWVLVNGFDEKLFIDGVDRDFCFRLKKSGFRIVQDNSISILHSLGDLQCRKIFNRTIYVTNHSDKRKYYMARNAIYLDSKHNTHLARKYILKLIGKTMFYEKKKKFTKIRAIMGGYWTA